MDKAEFFTKLAQNGSRNISKVKKEQLCQKVLLNETTYDIITDFLFEYVSPSAKKKIHWPIPKSPKITLKIPFQDEVNNETELLLFKSKKKKYPKSFPKDLRNRNRMSQKTSPPNIFEVSVPTPTSPTTPISGTPKSVTFGKKVTSSKAFPKTNENGEESDGEWEWVTETESEEDTPQKQVKTIQQKPEKNVEKVSELESEGESEYDSEYDETEGEEGETEWETVTESEEEISISKKVDPKKKPTKIENKEKEGKINKKEVTKNDEKKSEKKNQKSTKQSININEVKVIIEEDTSKITQEKRRVKSLDKSDSPNSQVINIPEKPKTKPLITPLPVTPPKQPVCAWTQSMTDFFTMLFKWYIHSGIVEDYDEYNEQYDDDVDLLKESEQKKEVVYEFEKMLLQYLPAIVCCYLTNRAADITIVHSTLLVVYNKKVREVYKERESKKYIKFPKSLQMQILFNGEIHFGEKRGSKKMNQHMVFSLNRYNKVAKLRKNLYEDDDLKYLQQIKKPKEVQKVLEITFKVMNENRHHLKPYTLRNFGRVCKYLVLRGMPYKDVPMFMHVKNRNFKKNLKQFLRGETVTYEAKFVKLSKEKVERRRRMMSEKRKNEKKHSKSDLANIKKKESKIIFKHPVYIEMINLLLYAYLETKEMGEEVVDALFACYLRILYDHDEFAMMLIESVINQILNEVY